MERIISGLQQIGIGVPNVHEAFDWYNRNIGMDVPAFDDPGEAGLMLPYTGGKPHYRHAILALNMAGGGGYEIWQYTSREPQPAQFSLRIGDLGFTMAKVKSRDVKASWNAFKSNNINVLSGVVSAPDSSEHFYMKDPYGNLIEVVSGHDWFSKTDKLTGGPKGFVAGVSDMEKSLAFYRDALGFDEVVYDQTGEFADLALLEGGNGRFRRILLRHSVPHSGAFSRFFGSTEIELLQALDYSGRRIFENRYWGDLGYIHACFDVRNMDTHKQACVALGYPFTVDSANSFDMGQAAGRFVYLEDPDGALIEMVETFKLPVIKKIGWYHHLTAKNQSKALPDWLLKSMRFSRVKPKK